MIKKVINCDTPVGNFFMVIKDNKVINTGFGNCNESLEQIESHLYKNLVTDYFNGDPKALNKIKYEQSSTDFTNCVWKTISKIPYGQTINYKRLAKLVGKPKAIRASASACGRNNIALIVPCHRIVKSDGGIGEYLYGSKIKEFLLNLEKSQKNT